MKFFKLIFSRLVIIIISILLQIFLFISANFLLTQNFAWIDEIFDIIGLVVLIILITRLEPSSYKLPWVIVILLFPIVGITLYLLFARVDIFNESQIKYFKNKDDFRPKEIIDISSKISNHQAIGQIKYLQNTSFLNAYSNCHLEYLPTGETFFEKMIEELKTAKKYIFLEYFIIGEGKLWDEIYQILKQKVKEGVEVHVMYDDVGSISTVPDNFVFKLRDEGIQASKFNPLKLIVSVRYNNRDHRKICVIDGKKGFISGCNMADEYVNINSPYGIWKDNGIFMKGKCVDSLVYLFIELYNYASIKYLNIDEYLYKKHREYKDDGIVFPYGDGPRPIYEDYIGMNVYLNIINQAKNYIYITSPYLIVEYEFVEALKNAVKRGVDVRIITPQVADKKVIKIMTKSYYQELIEGGVKIYEFKDGFIHAKTMLCDDEYATVGTVNLDYRSFVHHFECGVWMYKTNVINDIKNDFINLFNEKTVEIDIENAKLSLLERPFFIILRLFTPLL